MTRHSRPQVLPHAPLHPLDKLYLALALPVFIYTEFFHALLGLQAALPFLPLLLYSIYCSLGIVTTYLRSLTLTLTLTLITLTTSPPQVLRSLPALLATSHTAHTAISVILVRLASACFLSSLVIKVTTFLVQCPWLFIHLYKCHQSLLPVFCACMVAR